MKKIMTVFGLFLVSIIVSSCGMESGSGTSSRTVNLSSFLGDDTEVGSPSFSIPGKISCSCKGTSSNCVGLEFRFSPVANSDTEGLLFVIPTDTYPKISGKYEHDFSGCTLKKSTGHCQANLGDSIRVNFRQPSEYNVTEKIVVCDITMTNNFVKYHNY